MKKTAAILHSIQDAEHFVQQRHTEDMMLFSTHSCVDTYLKNFYGIDCSCLSSFFDTEKMISQRVVSYRIVEKLLSQLDKNISPLVNHKAGLAIDFFKTLYAYAGRYQLTTYLFLGASIRNLCDAHKVEKVYIYNCRFNYFLDNETDMGTFASFFLKGLPYEIIRYIPNKKRFTNLLHTLKTAVETLTKRIRAPLETFQKIYTKITLKLKIQKFNKLSTKKKTILISEPLFEINFLIQEDLYKKYNLLFYNHDDSKILENNDDEHIHDLKLRFKNISCDFGEYDSYAEFFLLDIYSDFSKRIGTYLTNIQKLKEIHQRCSISLGVWGVDPICGDNALRYAYLQSKGVTVVGAQHGGLYGETLNFQYESAFKRCDYFIGYGFTKEDLLKLAPEKLPETEILPIGKVNLVRQRKRTKTIDILFPITNTTSMLEGGMIRIPPDRLTKRQIKLLKYLNELKNIVVYVKPFMGADNTNLSVWNMLKRFKNLHICDHLNLNSFLKHYHPKAVLIEYPSQPLWEVMHLDTEIFLMNDPVLPWEKQALEEVRMRVHYSEDTDATIQMIDAFVKGEIDIKRDNTFFNHYVSKDNAKENILQLFNKLLITEDYN